MKCADGVGPGCIVGKKEDSIKARGKLHLQATAEGSEYEAVTKLKEEEKEKKNEKKEELS